MSHSGSATGETLMFGRFAERDLAAMDEDERAAFDQVIAARGMVPGPYRIWIKNRKLIDAILPLGLHYTSGSSLSKAEIEIAVLLTCSRSMAVFATLEHEWIARDFGGLPPEKIDALVAGLPTSFDDPRQSVVYDLTSALLAGRIVPEGLYRRATDLLGDVGVTDLTATIGYFTAVALTLRVYEVPAHAGGLVRTADAADR